MLNNFNLVELKMTITIIIYMHIHIIQSHQLGELGHLPVAPWFRQLKLVGTGRRAWMPFLV